MKKPKATFSTGKIKIVARRISLGIAVVAVAVLLILWDAGVFVIPGLTPPERRKTAPEETATRTEDERTVTVDWAAWAEDQIFALYDVSLLESPLTLLTNALYDSTIHSLVRQVYGEDGTLSAFGGLILLKKGEEERLFLPDCIPLSEAAAKAGLSEIEKNAYSLLTTAQMTRIDADGAYRLTGRQTQDGKAILKTDDGETWVYDRESASFLPYARGLLWDTVNWETAPENAGDGSGLTLISENGLFGYTGVYRQGNRNVPVNIPCQYSVAFPYREGVAVMANADGRVTLRDARGDVILSDLTLLLPEGWREDDSFCGFSGGLLRTVFASFGETGALLSRNEGVLTRQGKVFSLPEGYRAVSFCEGVFTVTNGERYGYYSAGGGWIAPPDYEYAAPFREGIAVVTGEDGKQGLIDRQGKILLAPSFEEITSFSGGLAVVRESAVGQVLLWKVTGLYPPPGEDTPEVSDRRYYERVPISRGPKNTFEDGDEIIIVLPDLDNPPWVTTAPPSSSSKIYTVPVITDPPATTAPPATDPVETPPDPAIPAETVSPAAPPAGSPEP